MCERSTSPTECVPASPRVVRPVFCGSGWRSALAATILQDMGFDTVAHLGGGFTDWKAAGQAIEAVEART